MHTRAAHVALHMCYAAQRLGKVKRTSAMSTRPQKEARPIAMRVHESARACKSTHPIIQRVRTKPRLRAVRMIGGAQTAPGGPGCPYRFAGIVHANDDHIVLVLLGQVPVEAAAQRVHFGARFRSPQLLTKHPRVSAGRRPTAIHRLNRRQLWACNGFDLQSIFTHMLDLERRTERSLAYCCFPR